MRRLLYVTLALVVLAAGTNVLADWCHDETQLNGQIFCDDFDRYCTSPPPEWQSCPTGASRSDPALRNRWPWTSFNWNTMERAGSNWIIEEDQKILTTPPFGGRHANGGDEGGQLGQNTRDLTGDIQAALNGNTTVNGSDDEPLVLSFYITGGLQDANGIMYSNGYLELNLGDDDTGKVTNLAQAPTDWVLVGEPEIEECESCYAICPSPNFSVHVPWPSLCQQYEPRTASPDPCPPAQEVIRSSLAIGALAILDNNPCHCEDPANQVPSNYHVSFFDGYKWRILRSNMFPGNGGDFVWGDKFNRIVLTIKTETVEIYHWSRQKIGGVYVPVESFASDIPRKYLGDFNRLRAGTKEACRLQSGSYVCHPNYANGKKRPLRMGETRCDAGWQSNKSKFIAFDTINLTGGIGSVVTGACCLNDASCIETDLTSCTEQGGHWQPGVASCDDVTCCPYPFADADKDGDVDQEDFAMFQVCFTNVGGGVPVGCECLNRDGDSDIDSADFVQFSACYSGPNVPAVPVPGGCNP